MKRNIFFAIGAVMLPLFLFSFSCLYSYFYPKQYVQNKHGEYVNVNTKDDNTFPINKKTTYIVDYYYPEENRLLQEKISTIPELLGFREDEVKKYLNEYMNHLSKEEEEQGLCNYEMISYHDQEIHLRKTYGQPKKSGFIAKSYNGMVVILKADGKTVYEYTEISVNSLPEQLKEQINSGYVIDNEETLYNFLENYSS
ncbi:MAG: hypothetical protein ACI4F4_10670 [Lachnospiraceae bacterium]